MTCGSDGRPGGLASVAAPERPRCLTARAARRPLRTLRAAPWATSTSSSQKDSERTAPHRIEIVGDGAGRDVPPQAPSEALALVTNPAGARAPPRSRRSGRLGAIHRRAPGHATRVLTARRRGATPRDDHPRSRQHNQQTTLGLDPLERGGATAISSENVARRAFNGAPIFYL